MTKSLAGLRILVVEDEMLIAIMIEDILADHGCDAVSTAATVEKALALIATTHFDLVTLDMNLGGRNTAAVADALIARRVPFIFSTGYSGINIKKNYDNQLVLKKPFGPYQLIGMIERALPQIS